MDNQKSILAVILSLFLVISVVVATQAMAAPTVWMGASYIGAYFVGISGMMIAVILLSTFTKDLLMKYLRKILPHMERITGGLLIVAGIYVIYYQTALL